MKNRIVNDDRTKEDIANYYSSKHEIESFAVQVSNELHRMARLAPQDFLDQSFEDILKYIDHHELVMGALSINVGDAKDFEGRPLQARMRRAKKKYLSKVHHTWETIRQSILDGELNSSAKRIDRLIKLSSHPEFSEEIHKDWNVDLEERQLEIAETPEPQQDLDFADDFTLEDKVQKRAQVLAKINFEKSATSWGKAASGIIIVCQEDRTIFLAERSANVMDPHLWGSVGGAIGDDGYFEEDEGDGVSYSEQEFLSNALQEAREELGSVPNFQNLIGTSEFRNKNFVYKTFVYNISKKEKERWTPTIILNWENSDALWFDMDNLPRNLHHGVRFTLDKVNVYPKIEDSKPMIQPYDKNTFFRDHPYGVGQFEEFYDEEDEFSADDGFQKRLSKLNNLYKKSSLTDIVYHRVSLQAAKNILEKDKFLTSVAFGTQSESEISNKLYYLSTMRSPMSGYNWHPSGVLFKLDGRKLNQKYKAKPVDYWSSSTINKEREMEDRIILNSPYIEKASKYILEAHIYEPIDEEKDNSEYYQLQVEYLEKIVNLLEEKNIPYYIYLNRKDFRILNPRKRFGLQDWKNLFKEKNLKIKEPYSYLSSYDKFERLREYANFAEYFRKNDLDSIDKSYSSLWYNLKYDFHQEFAIGMANSIHNNRTDPEARELIDMIAKSLKHFGVTNIKNLIEIFKEKQSEYLKNKEGEV